MSERTGCTVIDADGHILEVADLWQTHLEAKYRDRALCIRRDEKGLEYLEINGKPSRRVRNGMPAGLGAMDLVGGIKFERPKTGCEYVDNAPFGARVAKERLQRLEQEGIEKAILYPTLGVLWVAECDDEDLTQAYVRAYNRWIVEFCSESGGRLLPIAQLSLGDPVAAEKELRRAAAAGAIGVGVPPLPWAKERSGQPNHKPLEQVAVEAPPVLRQRAGAVRGNSLGEGVVGQYQLVADVDVQKLGQPATAHERQRAHAAAQKLGEYLGGLAVRAASAALRHVYHRRVPEQEILAAVWRAVLIDDVEWQPCQFLGMFSGVCDGGRA